MIRVTEMIIFFFPAIMREESNVKKRDNKTRVDLWFWKRLFLEIKSYFQDCDFERDLRIIFGN